MGVYFRGASTGRLPSVTYHSNVSRAHSRCRRVPTSSVAESFRNMKESRRNAIKEGLTETEIDALDNKVEQSFNDYVQEKRRQIQLAVLEFLLLTYTLYNDDQKLSFREKRKIKDYLQVYVYIFQNHEMNILKAASKHAESLEYILGYVKRKEISKEQYIKTVELVASMVSSQYEQVILLLIKQAELL